MTFEQLKYIIEIQRSGTILAASQKLNVSPPAISKAVSNLENELNTNIFIRTRSGTQVTEDGQRIIQLAQKILDCASEMQQMSWQHGSYTLRLEIYPQAIMDIIPAAITDFKQTFNNTEIIIDQTSISSIFQKINAQKIDIGLFSTLQALKPTLDKNISLHPLISTRLCVLANKHFPLKDRPFLEPQDLAQYQFVVPNDAFILNYLELLFQPIGMPQPILKTNDQNLMKKTVLTSGAIGTCSELLRKSDPLITQGELFLIPLKHNGDFLAMDYLYAYHAKKQLNAAERHFIQCLKKIFQ